ncbi:DUF5107 domain-containing protein [Devosia sp.]|uniref:DUF5107 domain-containing protein n=1 Tax=Devosia sp. TaxID=1871048 RepID=UPI001ACC1EF6|nr:DUF5107 domain-containing protein [Devosia sp.]MBN9335826.1 DUF5107 domain-containing protein [Devosia sp.]
MATSIYAETLSLPASRLGQPSNLPRFRWQQPIPDTETPPNFGLSEEESSHGFSWGKDSILPYQVSDDYDRDLKPGTLEVLVIENGRLRAVVAPSLGGRLLELKDLSTGRDLVFRNPVFQPANLAALNAWFSGGIEWNGLIPGHTPFTCAPVFAGVRETSRGPILRIYEFDRIVEATWQIDLFLPADSAVLFAHGRIVNPTDTERLAYWWTNVAVPMTPGTRVLSPADYSIEHIWPGNNLGRCDFPRSDWDASYPENWENATSVFFRAPSAPRLFIASLDRHGYGLAQCSTAEMPGRKFFYFGSGAGGQNWMDYLSRPGEGDYLEIQSGMTPTQNQRFALAAHEEREWTEAFMPLQLDARAHDPTYGTATDHAADAIAAIISVDDLAEMDAFLRGQARLELDVRYSNGDRWGARQERLTGKPLAAGLDFSVAAAGDYWDDLAQGRAVAPSNLTDMPVGVAVSRLWIERIREGDPTWVGELMLATAALDRGERHVAAQHVAQSLALKPNWAAYRLEALLADDRDTKVNSYLRAWNGGDAPPALAVEIAQYFGAASLSAELKAFVEALPAPIRSNERIVLARAVVAANEGDLDELERLLFDRPFATIREGETLLSDLWARLRRGRLEAQLKRAASAEELKADLKTHPVPRALNLRMHEIET